MGFVFGAIGSSIGLYKSPPVPIANIVATMIVLAMILGAVFGAIYLKFYDLVPGKGVSKGLYFGLMIWLIKNIAGGADEALLFLEIPSAIRLIFVGFFLWVTYGFVLGALYKK